MQKRLRALMLKGYAREYRRHCPSSHQNARHRLFHVKCCVNGRVRKCRELRSQARIAHRDEACSRAAGSGLDISEERASAFRGHSHSKSPGPDNYILTLSLDLSNVRLDMKSNSHHYAIKHTQRVHALRHEAISGSTSPSGAKISGPNAPT
jgi:hypothetical protein